MHRRWYCHLRHGVFDVAEEYLFDRGCQHALENVLLLHNEGETIPSTVRLSTCWALEGPLESVGSNVPLQVFRPGEHPFTVRALLLRGPRSLEDRSWSMPRRGHR